VVDFADARSRLGRPDQVAARSTAAHLDRLTKPRGSLGRLEALAVQLAGIAGESPPPVPDPGVVAVFAGDHGVLAEGVSPWPAEVTAQMVANFCAGGAAINVLARHARAGVVVIDVGVAADLSPADGLVPAKVRAGTANLAEEPAMTAEETTAALDIGATVADDLVTKGARCLITGDMGIGNTTPSAALIAAFTGRPASAVTGRGTGIGDDEWDRKVQVVERGLARTAAEATVEPEAVLASLGGLEIAALAGFIVAGAAACVPVLVDGVIAVAAGVVAEALAPGCAAFCVAGHRSIEPGASAGLDHLGLSPLLDLDLRLGEGTGACLALPVLQGAARIVREMATFDSAGVSDKTAGGVAGPPPGAAEPPETSP
jgi:nicotinate-nucleotide--dimethylbenzimidazole phosphoribosyltransferase